MRLKPLTSVELVFVCASMTRPEQVTSTAELARLHRTQGYSQIAVHLVIEQDGSVVEGRPLNKPGALAGKHNPHALQVCLLGGVSDAMETTPNFTDAQQQALSRIVEERGLPTVYAPDYPR